MLKRWLSSFFYPKYPIYVFHHIPKCGGTSVRHALENWFVVFSDYLTLAQLKGQEEVNAPIRLGRLNSTCCLCGHFESEYNHLELRYPDILANPNQFKLFTFLRDPLELRVSLYYYEIQAGRRKSDDQSLSNYLLQGTNYMAQRFRCTKDNYQRILDRYVYIGLQENLQLSMDQLADVLHKPKVRLDTTNQAVRDSQHDEIREDVVQGFKKNNFLDYQIYEYGKQKNTLCFE